MATRLYGSGLRLLECARLRIKDVDTVQELVGHNDVSTTIYTHVLNRGPGAVRSPAEQLLGLRGSPSLYIRLTENRSLNRQPKEARSDEKPLRFNRLE